MKKRIAIVGAGNAGCITALHYYLYGKDSFDITIYYNPAVPIEKVGQGVTAGITHLIGEALGMNWYNNTIGATFKTGILYDGWGKKNDKIFHPFLMSDMSMHFVPSRLSKVVLESGYFNVIEKDVKDPEKEIDADYIFDCRGKLYNDKDHYEPLINPLNSVLLCHTKDEPSYKPLYTGTVATPNGWTFVIPQEIGTSYGYLYNDTITSTQAARDDFLERFNLPETDGTKISFENYMAKNVFVGERTILNGNRAMFLEPLEATASSCYHYICKYFWDYIGGRGDKYTINIEIRNKFKEIQNFVLWHYQFGSKYDTPFWKYAKSLPFKQDYKFKHMLKTNNLDELYGAWNPPTFKLWQRGVS